MYNVIRKLAARLCNKKHNDYIQLNLYKCSNIIHLYKYSLIFGQSGHYCSIIQSNNAFNFLLGKGLILPEPITKSTWMLHFLFQGIITVIMDTGKTKEMFYVLHEAIKKLEKNKSCSHSEWDISLSFLKLFYKAQAVHQQFCMQMWGKIGRLGSRSGTTWDWLYIM